MVIISSFIERDTTNKSSYAFLNTRIPYWLYVNDLLFHVDLLGGNLRLSDIIHVVHKECRMCQVKINLAKTVF